MSSSPTADLTERAPDVVALDVARLLTDRDRQERRVTAAERRLQEAQAALDRERAALDRERAALDRLGDAIDLLRTYADSTEIGRDPSENEDLRPLANANGVQAIKRYATDHPGETVGLSELVEELRVHGFAGSTNSIAVALSNLVKTGSIVRTAKGVYQFPPLAEP